MNIYVYLFVKNRTFFFYLKSLYYIFLIKLNIQTISCFLLCFMLVFQEPTQYIFFLRCYLPLSPEWSTKECNLLFIFTFTCTNIYFTPKAQAYYVIIYSFFFSHNKFKMHTIYLIIHKGVLLGRRCIFLLWGKYITSVPCGWKLQYVGRALDRVDFCLVIQVRNNINSHKNRELWM